MSAVLDQLEVPNAPGLYAGISAEEYHRWPYASQTILKIMRDRSPLHAYQQMTNPPESTPALRLGDAVHVAVLQPDLFRSRFAVAPDVDRRTKAGKEEWAEFVAENADKSVLKADEWGVCESIREAVHAHPIASKLLAGEAEQSALWVDPATGVTCKARFDIVARSFGTIIDLKTTIDASPSQFTRAIYNYGYYIQAAHYLAGARALGIEVDLFAIIAVEKEPPYAVAVYQIEDEALQAGIDELRPLMATFARCQETGVWPSYDDQVTRITLPHYAWRQIEERVSVGV